MKRLIYFLVVLTFSKLNGQTGAPDKINYQGVARDVNGVPITVPIDLHFVITNNANNTVHNEIQSNIQPNTFGIFNTQIGAVTVLSPTISWQAGPYTLSVSIKPSSASTFSFVGSQALASVPFALYAEKAGNAMPTGSVNGQTLFWDATATPPKWKIDNNLTNDGAHVGIGLIPAGLKNRLHVITIDPNDSSVVYASHLNAQGREAVFRGVAAGTSPSNNGNPFVTAIYGGQFFGINKGSGLGVGSYGQGIGDSLAIGLIGIGTSTTVNGRAVGVYGSAPLSTGDNFAAIFDKGKVLIMDSLIISGGAPGDVLTKNSTGMSRWMPAGAGSSPWIKPTTTVTSLQSPTDFVGIGTSSPFNKVSIEGSNANTGFPYANSPSTKVNIHNNDITNLNYQSLAFTTKSSQSGGLYSSSEIVSENIDHGISSKGNILFLTRDPSNINERMRIDWDGKVGINSFNPSAQLDVKNSSNGVAIYANTNAASNATNPAIFGEAAGTSTNNAGVYGLSNSSSGVKGFSQNSNGVWGESNNNVGVFGLSTGSGSAGKFLLQGTSSANNAVYIASNSTPPALKAEAFNTGAAIEAKHSNPSAGSSNAALLINDGHIKSVGAVTTLSNTATIGGFSSLTSTCTNCTDVKGAISLNVNVGTVSNGDYMIVMVNFTKAYAQNPVINLTPVSDFGRMTYYIFAVSPTFFQIKIVNSTGVGITPPTNYKLNYFVIE